MLQQEEEQDHEQENKKPSHSFIRIDGFDSFYRD